MKQWFWMVLLVCPWWVSAGDKQTLAVVDFTDSTQLDKNPNASKGRGMAHIFTQYIEQDLMRHFVVVEREKLHAVRKELKLAKDNMISGSSAKLIGNLTSARLLLTGTIVENSIDERTNDVYGVKRTNLVREMVVIYKVLHTTTGEILMNRAVRETERERGGGSKRQGFSTRLVQRVSRKIAEEIGRDLDTLAIKEVQDQAKREVLIWTNPKGAEIILAGQSMGNSPVSADLVPGKTYTLQIKKLGYWKVRDNIKVELEDEDHKVFRFNLKSMDVGGR